MTSFTILAQLRNAEPDDRPRIISDLYNRNREFFRDHYPAVDSFIEENQCPYSIQITDSFLAVIDGRTGQVAHPEPLDTFAEMMAAPEHGAWVDLFSLEVAAPEQYPLHARPVTAMYERLAARFPEYPARYRAGVVNLKPLPGDGRRFSPPVIFLGIFHGLHVAHHLHSTEVDSVLLVEPEPERFEVSLYFLDYEAIWKREGRLYLFIGPQLGNNVFDAFFSTFRVTPHLWCRVLPGYVMEQTPYYMEQFRMLQRSKLRLVYPLDYMVRDHAQGLANLRQGLPLLASRPDAPIPAAIAVVASGPSLDEQALAWLGKHRDELVIFAVHTAVTVLRRHGIRPDFQFCLDTVFHEELISRMDLYPDVPLVLSYQAAAAYTTLTDTPLLVAAADVSHPVHIMTTLLDAVAPSTTTLAFALACHCRPETIFLLGCDFGFRSPERHHARGTLYIDEQGDETRPFHDRETATLVVPANFPGSEPVLSTPFFTQARLGVEKAIGRLGRGIRVINLSDGALVQGARPASTADCRPGRVADRRMMARQIARLFAPAEQGRHWRYCRGSGRKRYRCLQRRLPEQLAVEHFSWPEAMRNINDAISLVMAECRDNGHDSRLDIWWRLLSDLLSHLCICLYFFDTEEEGAEVYGEGVRIVAEVLAELPWPAALEN
ncbi:MAG TPA: DUF115 domain-containing protein [Desulfobulbus sp.]|nr:DUF115 domain-containing protein [Desulfobulbus sp.]